MAQHVLETFVDQRVVLDEDEFLECTFTNCDVVYQGRQRAYLVGCAFHGRCTFRLEGAALRTPEFLKGVYHGLGPAGRRLVEETFDEVRRPSPDAAGPGPAAPPTPGRGSAPDAENPSAAGDATAPVE